MSVQSQIHALSPTSQDSTWRGKPNEWLRQLAGPALSKVGVHLVQSICGGVENTSRAVAHKLEIARYKIDVKIATHTNVGPYPAFVWRNIRSLERITHIAFIAIFPSDARAFLVPIDEIPEIALKDSKVPGEKQIVITGEFPPAWMQAHGR